MNTVEKVFCPSCGAPVAFEDGCEEVFCSHCGSRLHRDDDNVVLKMEHKEKMAEYADRHEEREFETTKARNNTRDYYIAMGLFFLTVVALSLLMKFN